MNMKQIKSWLLVKAAMIAALFGVAANVNAEDKFYIPDFSIEAGETKELAIQFESDKVSASDPSQLEYVAFQFDIYMPEGLTIVQKKGKYNFTFNTDRNDDHTFSPALQADGAIRVAAASLTNAYFWETSGDFVYFSVTAAADFAGDHEITMKTINFSDIEGNMTTLADVTTKVTGPATGDQTVAVTGITLDKATAELTEGESLTLVATVAPDNATDKTVVWSSSDETVATVKDGVVTTLKAGEATITAKAGEQTATCVVTVKAKVVETGNNKFYLPDFSIEAGETKELAIQFESDNVSASDPSQLNYVAFQFDIYLPEGLTIVQKKGKYNFTFNTDRNDDHTFSPALQADGAIRVAAASLTNAYFWETSGDFVYFSVTAAADFAGDHEITMKTINFSDIEGNMTTLADVTTKVTGPATGDQTVAVTGITLDKATAELTEGESLTLVATVAPDNATDKTVVWSSSDETVATVKDGVVTTLKAGEATITAKAGEQTATCVVTVKAKVIAVTGITLDKATAEVTEGESLTLVATVAPDNATDKTVVWSSSDETVATVKDGVVTTLKAGEATITAKAGEQTATCVVTVKAKVIAVTGITLDKATAELIEGESLTLVATVAPDNATDKTVVWTSSDETVATVKDGVVTTLKAGEATITAKAGDQTATCVVTVKAKVIAVTGITLDKATAEVTEGESLTLVATVAPDNATDKTVVWSSSDETVATVKDGVVTTLKAGEATITAKAGDQTATCVVTVKENIKITEVSVTLTHTASSYCETDANAYISTVDAAKEHVNNSKFSGTWQGAAYAEFSVLLPEGISIKSATLTWSGIGSSKDRTTDIMYVNAGETLDYETMKSTGTEKVNLPATNIATVTFKKSATTDFTTDVTEAVKTVLAAGQNYVIFKFTNNVGAGDIVGKGAAEKAPVLTLETVDASKMTSYTVKYVDEAGTEVKAADVYGILIGETATLAAENKAPFYNEDNTKKYVYVSCDKESIVTVADSASNVITATFREAAKYNYTVETTDDSGSLTITMGSYSGFEGENVKVPYYAYVLNEADSTLYQAAATNKEYNKYVDLTQDNMKVQVAYTPTTIKNVVYYQEAENVEGLTKITTGNTAIRSSNSASAYAADADVVLTTLAPGKYKIAAVIYDATKALNSQFSFIAGADTVLKAVSTAANWTNCASDEFTLTVNAALSLAKGGSSSKGVDLFYIQKTGDVAPRFDLTAYNDTVAWANEVKATLNAEDATEAELIVTIDDFIASAAQWLEETLADPEATQDDVNFIAQDLKLQVNAVMERLPILKLWPEAEALRMEADSVYASYTEPTDEAGLVNALRSFPRSPMFIMNVEELQTAIETLKTALAAFIAENEEVGGPVALSADMFKEWDKVEADAQVIGDAVSEMGIGKEIGAGAMVYGTSVVDPLRYADLTAYDKMVIEGTSGVQLRILMNRALGGEAPNFNGALVEVNVTIGEDGKAEVDLTAYDYVHLNAIKTGWGSAAGTITSITLETIEPAKIAYLNAAGDADDAIYDALVAAGYAVDPLAYADVTLSDEVIESELAGYDVVVLGGSTGSGTNLAKTANLLLGKVNVLSTKSFWYKHYGANGGNPGTADAPSLSLTKAAGYEEHPIYAGIEGGEFAVFNDMGKETGRYLQSNGSFADAALAQATIGTTLGANCIGEAWVDGKGYIIIPVDGLQPSGYLTADGAQLFVNAVDYLIAGEQFEYNLVEGVRVEATQWPADIYDLSGRMIKKAATSLEGLDKGLYFIQGKKVLVK